MNTWSSPPKAKTLYAIKLAKPSAPFTIKGTAGWEAGVVTSVRLLGTDSAVNWVMTPQGLRIVPPPKTGRSQHAWAFEIVTDQQQHVPNVIQTDASKAMKDTKEVNLEGHDVSAVPNVPGSSVVVETATSADGFKQLVPREGVGVVKANQKTSNDPVVSLIDGKLAKGFGPIFSNGIRNGAYKMDLGSVRPVSAITSWSHNWKAFRGAQKLVLYGSGAASDPGWDLSRFVPLGTIDTTGEAKANFTAASLRAAAGQSLGQFRWIVWAVSPVTRNGGGENTAFQELTVEVGVLSPK